MEKTLVIIDGNSLMNRAYYAIQRPMMTKDGMYTQGIFGFLNMLSKILKDYAPTHIAVAFDRKAPTFRHLEYDEYKAGRKKMPPELAMEFPVLKDILTAMNIHMLEIDGFEADDILGTVSKKAEEEGIKPYIITGDKDAFQLASDKTTVIFTKRGTSEFDAYDEKAVYEKYGFSPQQFIDFKGLMGDQSDNIPGIPGVGEKTATKLILEYGSVENLIASTDSMKKSKLRDKIEENAQLAVMSKRLATICRDIPVEVDFEAMKYEGPDYGKLIEIYKKLEFNLFIKRLTSERKLARLPADENTAEISDGTSMPASNDSVSSADIQEASEYDGDIPYSDITAINAANVETVHTDGADELKKALEELKGADRIWLKVFHDNAHVKKPEISSVCMLACGGAENKADRLYVIHWNESAPGALAEFFGHWRGRLCGHDIKDSYYALFSNGAAKLPDPRGYVFETYCDTAISAYLIDPQKKSIRAFSPRARSLS